MEQWLNEKGPDLIFGAVILAVLLGFAWSTIVDALGDARDHWRERMGGDKEAWQEGP